MKIEQFEVELTDLSPTEHNPRQINQKDFEKLKKSLKEFPEMKEIREVVIDENNRILGGHMRVRALKELGEKTVYVKQVFGLTEEQKDEFVIKDNIANGEWDMDELANSWSELPLDDWGLLFHTADNFGTSFELPDGDKNGMQVMSFTLADEQAEAIKKAIKEIDLDGVATYGNTNRNGNKLYGVITEWEKQKR